MAHYAFLNENNIVVEVIVGKDENEDGIDWENYYGKIRGLKCKRTSYSGKIRGTFAGRGYFYDEELDSFFHPLHVQTENFDAPQNYPLCRYYDIITKKVFERYMPYDRFEKLLRENTRFQKVENEIELRKTIKEYPSINVTTWVNQA